MRSDVFDALFLHAHLIESHLGCCAFETCDFTRLSDDEKKQAGFAAVRIETGFVRSCGEQQNKYGLWSMG